MWFKSKANKAVEEMKVEEPKPLFEFQLAICNAEGNTVRLENVIAENINWDLYNAGKYTRIIFQNKELGKSSGVFFVRNNFNFGIKILRRLSEEERKEYLGIKEVEVALD